MFLLYLFNFPENFSLLPGQKLTFFGKMIRKVTKNRPKFSDFWAFWNSEAKIRHPPYTPTVHSRCPRHVIARPILLHYPGKSPRRPPQMLQQAKVFKNTTQNTQGKETIIDKHTYTEQKSTPTQRTAMRKRRSKNSR